MYLLGPMQFSFAEIVTFSAATVIALIGVKLFFPQRMVAACRLTVLLLWMLGSYAAVRGGFIAGLSMETPPDIYPWYGVFREVSIVTAETMCLYFIVCYPVRGRSIRNLLVATVVFGVLVIWDNPPTDMPGYMYANSNFVMPASLLLFFGMLASVIARATDKLHHDKPLGYDQISKDLFLSERRLEAVVIGPSVNGGLEVAVGRESGKFVTRVSVEVLPPELRFPNSHFVAVVKGRTVVRVEAEGRPWIEIQNKIRGVLNRDWDPIGVVPDGIDDEYDGYIGVIYSLLRSGANAHTIANHLISIEVEQMGMTGASKEALLIVAAKLRELQLPVLRGPNSAA